MVHEYSTSGSHITHLVFKCVKIFRNSVNVGIEPGFILSVLGLKDINLSLKKIG